MRYNSLSNTRWDCKYYVVFILKKRHKIIFGLTRKHLGEVLQELARQKGVIIEEGHLMPEYLHMYLSIPPKLAVSNFVGFIKGK